MFSDNQHLLLKTHLPIFWRPVLGSRSKHTMYRQMLDKVTGTHQLLAGLSTGTCLFTACNHAQLHTRIRVDCITWTLCLWTSRFENRTMRLYSFTFPDANIYIDISAELGLHGGSLFMLIPLLCICSMWIWAVFLTFRKQMPFSYLELKWVERVGIMYTRFSV